MELTIWDTNLVFSIQPKGMKMYGSGNAFQKVTMRLIFSTLKPERTEGDLGCFCATVINYKIPLSLSIATLMFLHFPHKMHVCVL
jgi:hypothetical protein